MVAISRLALTLTVPALFTTALANLKITAPGTDLWWVANSQNILSWTCKDSTVDRFTVLVANQAELSVPLAIIAIQNNIHCSKIITADQSNLPVGSGYTVLFANPLNASEIYATSDEFEIQPEGSLYPTGSYN